MRGVCVRCGEERADWREICASCGFRPEGEGLLVAWLLSDQNLTPEQMVKTAARVKAGESIKPSERMLEKARHALGTSMASDPGLTTRQRVALLLTTMFLTPLPGWVCWLWWRRERPRAAMQALALALPGTLVFTVLVIWLA
jgi:hypothetical protein